ncbi:hypothetical protein [Cellulomonas oligotrophica]|uniref:Uncharacterized protein n=1 Tax=Cellulomonas oligotrophica TaxID=931536 RepID=A0A7Y9FKK9_9CELL|nr:hypothetical protein [Cellulomonas oligotrophica]NYD87766.1 hypothetical protein [Cellulomonas oligotrophica]GIG33029.1 hypothetical protein Col01nite_21880 [Cellulomonas oligotrophica]
MSPRAEVWEVSTDAEYRTRRGRPPVFLGDRFESGITEPDTTNVGARTGRFDPDEPLVDLVVGDGTGVLQSTVLGEEWHNRRIIGRWKRGAPGQKLVNCELTTPEVKPPWTQGLDYVLIDCTSTQGAGTGEPTLLDHVTINPRSRWVDLYGVKGGWFRLSRSRITGTVDGFMTFRWDTWVIDSLIHGLVRYADDTPRHVDGTHNDGGQDQGGNEVWITGTKIDVEQPLNGSLLGVLVTADYAVPKGFHLTDSWLLGGSVPVNYALAAQPTQPVIEIVRNRIRLGQKDYGGAVPRAHVMIPSSSRTHALTTIADNVDYDTGAPIIIKNG